MNAITRLGLWLVRISSPDSISPEVQSALIAARGSLSDIEERARDARERLALAIVDAKAANILHQPDKAEGAASERIRCW